MKGENPFEFLKQTEGDPTRMNSKLYDHLLSLNGVMKTACDRRLKSIDFQEYTAKLMNGVKIRFSEFPVTATCPECLATVPQQHFIDRPKVFTAGKSHLLNRPYFEKKGKTA